MFQEKAGGLLLPVQGLVTVELADERTGRILHRDTAENFISLQSIEAAKWYQRFLWGAFNPVESTDSYGAQPSHMPWFPTQHIAYWNDATAESSGTEDHIKSDLVGWASRQPVGSPTGKRGVVNVTESLFGASSSKWVFDWNTSQGNGTFQSVGFTRVDETNGFPVARFPETDFLSFTPAASGISEAPIWWDSTASQWMTVEAVSSSAANVIQYAAGGGAIGGTVMAFPGSTWGTNGSTPGNAKGIARIGTDIVTAGYGSSVTAKLTRHTSAAAVVFVATSFGLGSVQFLDVTIDGSGKIWTACSDGKMRMHNATTGAIEATITPAIAPTSINGIAYDPADGYFWVTLTISGVARSVTKIDSSGNTIGPFFSVKTAQTAVSTTAPFAGGLYYVPPSSVYEYVEYQWYSANNGGTGNIVARTPVTASSWSGGFQLAMKGSDLFAGGYVVGATGLTRASKVKGGTLGTRALLGSPVTKTSAQTLKITYQFNFS